MRFSVARVLTGRARLTWETAVLVRMSARTRGEFLAGEAGSAVTPDVKDFAELLTRCRMHPEVWAEFPYLSPPNCLGETSTPLLACSSFFLIFQILI